MKQKSTSSNKFRHVPFTDRIAKLSIDVSYWHNSLNTSQPQAETHFRDAVIRFCALDHAAHYEAFLNDIPDVSRELLTYAQLLYHQKRIVDALIKHLSVEGSSSLPSILELTAAFTRDLRDDLHSHIWELLEAIIRVLERSHEDSELLEIGFSTLAKIFWFQRKPLVKQLDQVFVRFNCLFSSKRIYIRRFIAEALAFLLRRSNDLDKLVVFLAQHTCKERSNSLLDSIARLYFNASRVMKGQFHSAAPQILGEISRASVSIDSKEDREVAIEILVRSISFYANYSTTESGVPILDVLLKQFESSLHSCSMVKSNMIAKLLLTWIEQKNGKTFNNPSLLLELLIEHMKNVDSKMEEQLTDLLTKAIVVFHQKDALQSSIIAAVKSFLEKTERSNFDKTIIFLEKLSSISLFDVWLMPVLGSFTTRMLLENDDYLYCELLKFYANLCAKRRPISLQKGLDNIIQILESSVRPSEGNSNLALLVTNVIFITEPSRFARFSFDNIIDFFRNMGSCENSLKVLCMILPHVSDFHQLAKEMMMKKVINEVVPLFGHWNSSVRQIALQTVLLVSTEPNGIVQDNGDIKPTTNAFEILLEAEQTELTLEKYRHRLILLRQLAYGAHYKCLPKCSNFALLETVPLRVLVAQFYERFTIFWPHMYEIIESYAYGLNIDTFFEILFSFISNATENMNKHDTVQRTSLCEKFAKCDSNEVPDYGLFRLQLFTLLSNISELTERRSKLLSPLFVKICMDEFHVGYVSNRKENLIKTTNENDHAVGNEKIVSDGATEKIDSDALQSDQKIRKAGPARKVVRRSVIALLNVYGLFKGPKSIYMSKEISELYEKLLMMPDEEIQKLALKCIFTFKHKYITPYKENLDNFVNDKTFLDEMIRFGVDNQDTIIDDKHRDNLMPIILRLLYGKYVASSGKGDIARRLAIFRFLGGCSASELDVFINFLFSQLLSVTDILNESVEEMCSSICSNFDPMCVVPMNVLSGSLNSLKQVASKLSPIFTDAQQQLLFKLCLIAGLVVRLAAESIEGIANSRYSKPLKELRRASCDTFKQLFFAYQNRTFSVDELNGFFNYFIVPLCRSESRGPVAPLSVLRLFLSWTKLPRLFSFLRIKLAVSDNNKSSVIAIVCNTLLSNSANASAKVAIVDAIINLINLADEDGMNSAPAEIELQKLREINGVNVGTLILIDEMPKLLGFILDSMPSAGEKGKLNLKHLEILRRMSPFIADSITCERFVSVLFSYLESDLLRSDEVVLCLLDALSSMMAVIEGPSVFLPRLVHLHSSLKSRVFREGLVKLQKAFVSNRAFVPDNSTNMLNHISQLDSWDGRRIGEPDHEIRCNAYTAIHSILSTKERVDFALIEMTLHNDFHVITQMEDISLRSMAVMNFRQIIEYVDEVEIDESEKIRIIDMHMIPLILNGLHEKNEMVRHDFVSLLVSLISAFPTHKQLSHFVQLFNKTEVDLDFFENITHLQVHRRQRAFSRLSHGLEEKTIKIPSDILYRYVVPLLQHYIVDFNSKTTALSDEALNLLSKIVRTLPWKKYIAILDFYLKQLKKKTVNHKAIIRIIVSIVGAFHFTVTDSFEESVSSITNVEKSDEFENENADHNVSKLEKCVNKGGNTNSKMQKAIYQKIVGHLIPRLKDCATGKDLSSHRKAQSGKYYKEEDDIQRAPVALATVKLLLKMPERIMDENLHGVILKMCSLLMSRAISVREVASKTMVEIAKTLGPNYLRFMVREMKNVLAKGYQVHVMINTVQKLLSALEDQFKPGDIDHCTADIIEVCNMDLFGDVADEKSVTGITKDVPEAKSSRSFETYGLIARHISDNCINVVVAPLKKVIESRPTSKVLQLVSRILRHFAIGIGVNKNLSAVQILTLAYQIIKENINIVSSGTNYGFANNAENDNQKLRPQSCLILEKEPTRVGVIVKVSKKSKLHVFVEFGLEIVSITMRKKVFESDNDDDVALLNPFVEVVLKSLQLKYDKIVLNALRCTLSLSRFPLPTLKAQMPDFIDRLFVLLADYSSSTVTASKGPAQEITQLIFKCFTQIVKDAPEIVFTPKRLQILLSHIESDIVDSQKHATAFPLVKAIISRKLQDSKILDIINYLTETSIVSDVAHIREQCRQVIALFVGKHPQSKKPVKYIEFYLEQLEYEHEDGRKSAIEMLNMFFERMMERVNDEYGMLAFVKLSIRLINDESEICRLMISLAIEKLLQSVGDACRNDLFLAARDWLQSSKELHHLIAMQIFVIFSKVRGPKFVNTIRELLPIISKNIKGEIIEKFIEKNIVRIIDCLLHILAAYQQHLTQFATEHLFDNLFSEMKNFARCIESEPIQISSARLCGLLFSSIDKKIFKKMSDPAAKEMVEWTILQLRRRELSDTLADQTAKNAIFLMDSLDDAADIEWLCRKLALVCTFELVKLPTQTLRRMTVFKMAAAIITRADDAMIDLVTNAFMPQLFREIQRKSSQHNEELQQIAREVSEKFKMRLGDDKFAQKVTECQKFAAAKFEARKRKAKEELVIDPVRAAQIKRKRNKAKSLARSKKFGKRKIVATARTE